MKYKILIGAGGSGTSFAAASRLKANWGSEIEIIITDTNDKDYVTSSIFSSYYYKVPKASDPKFKSEIIKIITKHNVNMYIPILNEEIIIANEIKKEFKKLNVWCSPEYTKLINKDYAHNFLNNIGIKTPKAYNLDEAKLQEKVFIKPKNGFGSKNAQILISSQLEILSLDYNDYIIQEVCISPEVTIDSFYDPKSDTCYAYCRERIEVKSGVCTKTRLFFDQELSEIAYKIAKAIHQKGIICFQVMKSPVGWVVTDLNLRHGAGTALTCAAGFDIISATFALKMGNEYKHFVRHLSPAEEIILTRQYSEFIMKVTQ
ncbi:ATP-grasp domain-containing protein [Acinetobacter johnsonii]|uniref:ATP-grasp domain-containing protein n=1 Tax=Acinetobacter johnsonii TaxID=40214 RepID=UPI003D16B9BC